MTNLTRNDSSSVSDGAFARRRICEVSRWPLRSATARPESELTAGDATRAGGRGAVGSTAGAGAPGIGAAGAGGAIDGLPVAAPLRSRALRRVVASRLTNRFRSGSDGSAVTYVERAASAGAVLAPAHSRRASSLQSCSLLVRLGWSLAIQTAASP